ncbi:MAG: hypothetical protein AAGC57_07035 [Pseudomonadota bacterium]
MRNYAQGFQPKHFLAQVHPGVNPDADKLAAEHGFESGYELVNYTYGASDWTDTSSPMLRDAEKTKTLPKATQPTLKSQNYIADTTEGRKLVANPYSHQVDTASNQLPSISRQDEVYINANEGRILKLVNGVVDYESRLVTLPAAPILFENQEQRSYTVQHCPTISLPN